MGWNKTPEDRKRDAAVYQDPEYVANRKLALKRAGGKCEQLLDTGQRCGSTSRVQVDHIKPVSQHGTHHLDNLRVLCRRCHLKKSAQEGGGYRKRGRRGPKEDPPLVGRTKW